MEEIPVSEAQTATRILIYPIQPIELGGNGIGSIEILCADRWVSEQVLQSCWRD